MILGNFVSYLWALLYLRQFENRCSWAAPELKTNSKLTVGSLPESYILGVVPGVQTERYSSGYWRSGLFRGLLYQVLQGLSQLGLLYLP